MNAAQFQTWVKQGPTASDVSALRALVARYPYRGVLRLWLAKASHMAEDLNRNEDLLAAGAHVPSRRALFQALMGPALVEAAQHIQDYIRPWLDYIRAQKALRKRYQTGLRKKKLVFKPFLDNCFFNRCFFAICNFSSSVYPDS